MAPRRKSRSTPGQLYDFKIRMPEDIRQRIDDKSKKTGLPRNRTVINELADFPRLEKIGELADHVDDLGNVLARYSARIVMHDLSDNLLKAVDAVLNAEGGAQQAAIERLRVERDAMRKTGKGT